jgi:hypothetical protein
LSRASFLLWLGSAISALVMAPASILAADTKRSVRRAAKTPDTTVRAILFYGQSNAGAGGHAEPVLTEPVDPDRIMTFHTSRQIYGTQLVPPGRLYGIGTVRDFPKSPTYPATAMAYALAHAAAPATAHSYFLHTIWYGGQPLTAFMRGTTPWADLSAVAQRVPQVLASKGRRGEIGALVLLQGESGPPGRERYGGLLRRFLDETLPELKATAGQDRTPVAILMQSNASNIQFATAVGVAAAQWDVAHSRPQDTVLAGPMYQFPLSDAVHQSAVGRMMLGDLLTLVFRVRVERSEQFQPLHPFAATRRGDSIVIAFKRPKGSKPLQWDHDWVPPVPDYGFQVHSSSRVVKIAAVEITGPSEVTVQIASRKSPSDLTVSYAMNQPFAEGWAPGRGQLIAPTTQRSAFLDFGVRIPEIVAHYAIRFDMPVS